MNPHQNRLAKEPSPYLLQHAGNPVDWYPWGPEALARAAAEDKPILLSIGYSACHWCHVMERESFEDPAIARVMNERFVCIKVDREERPDLDQIYQLVVQLMGRSGGWPLTVFLTPLQRPFFGGTYFPPIARYGVPAFPTLLEAVSDAYRTKRDEVTAQADELTAAIARVSQHQAHGEAADGDAPYTLGADLLERVSSKLSQRFDEENGGFGSRPKFPNTMPLDVLLHRGALELEPRALARVRYALLKMREGGIYDQLGGGFHRYSTDERWMVPHFEKMLYDNALLLRLYADAYRATGEVRFADTAREIVAYAAREMTDLAGDGGGFYATQDADSEGGEGKFFVWSREEILAALPGDREAAEVAILRYGVTDDGNFEHTGKSVLHGAKSLEAVANHLGLGLAAAHEALGRARAALFAARELRVKPPRDEKILASWNGLFLGALADAGAALDEPSWVARASRAFAFVEQHLVHDADGDPARLRVDRHAKRAEDGTFALRGPGFLDDYAYLADAALDLWEATGKLAYLTRAQRLADALLEKFFDGATSEGGFYFTPEGGERLIHRAKDPFDHAVPSGTAMACKALLRLGAVVDAKYTVPAEATLKALAVAAEGNPFGFGQLIVVLDRLVRGSVDVVIAGHGPSDAANALGRVALRAYQPNRNVVWLLDDASRAACAAIAEGKDPAGAGPVAYVCKGRACSLPVSEPAELAKLLGTVN